MAEVKFMVVGHAQFFFLFSLVQREIRRDASGKFRGGVEKLDIHELGGRD